MARTVSLTPFIRLFLQKLDALGPTIATVANVSVHEKSFPCVLCIQASSLM